MRKTMLIIMSLSLAALASADSFVTRARVLESRPIVETVYEPYEECTYKTRTSSAQSNNIGDKIIGGLLGGAAGSALGKGSGRDAATGIGVLLGSEIAEGDGFSEGELIGGLAGGIIGNQVGKGSGRTAATGVGVLIGAIVGDNLQNGNQQSGFSSQQKVKVCEKKERSKKIITGYDVVYEYAGVRATGVLPYEPNEFVDINVGIDLVENRTSRANN